MDNNIIKQKVQAYLDGLAEFNKKALDEYSDIKQMFIDLGGNEYMDVFICLMDISDALYSVKSSVEHTQRDLNRHR